MLAFFKLKHHLKLNTMQKKKQLIYRCTQCGNNWQSKIMLSTDIIQCLKCGYEGERLLGHKLLAKGYTLSKEKCVACGNGDGYDFTETGVEIACCCHDSYLIKCEIDFITHNGIEYRIEHFSHIQEK